MLYNNYQYLNRINSPDDLKKLDKEEIPALNDEIRRFLVENVSKTGGHLASNLGVVELTVALHRVFSTPKDHIIFDVGHQSYVHKILTGRADLFDTLRQPGGLSGFEKIGESEHDCFGTGHSSTSVSAALGFAEADLLCGNCDRYSVAVVGDGAFTGGMIHEALNNCKGNLPLIIILNENEMSISKNIGRFAYNLSKLRSARGYLKTKRFTRRLLVRIPLIGKFLFKALKHTKKSIKNLVYGSNYFEDIGLYYIGPIDGNDYEQLETALVNAKAQGEAAIIHIKTQKGKGYAPAEENPCLYHSMPSEGSRKPNKKSFSQIFGDTLCEMAKEDKSICAVTAAMADGTGLVKFSGAYPDRFFDVGIAEEHALTFSAGLAAEGMRPFAAIYSTFLQRGYDNIIHDIALQNLPVKICIDRAGLNKGDGATHHGIFDVAFLSQIPNMTIFTPITEEGLVKTLKVAKDYSSPVAIRYPSGFESDNIVEEFYTHGFGTENIGVRSDIEPYTSPDVLIVTHGRIADEAISAKKALDGKNISCGIALLEVLKPYDKTLENLLPYLPKTGGKIIFLEEEIKNGGMGMILVDCLLSNDLIKNYNYKYKIIALDDSFAIQERYEDIYKTAKISADDIVEAVMN